MILRSRTRQDSGTGFIVFPVGVVGHFPWISIGVGKVSRVSAPEHLARFLQDRGTLTTNRRRCEGGR
jgi:hypothetical protein